MTWATAHYFAQMLVLLCSYQVRNSSMGSGSVLSTQRKRFVYRLHVKWKSWLCHQQQLADGGSWLLEPITTTRLPILVTPANGRVPVRIRGHVCLQRCHVFTWIQRDFSESGRGLTHTRTCQIKSTHTQSTIYLQK